MTTTTQADNGSEAQVNSTEEIDTTNNSSSTNTETVSFKVIYNKQKHDVTFPLDNTVIDLKKHLEQITGMCTVADAGFPVGVGGETKELGTVGWGVHRWCPPGSANGIVRPA